MKINRAILNVIVLSFGYAIVSSIQSWFYYVLDVDTWDCAKSRIIFDISFVICILIAPTLVTLAGSRCSMLTSYICHVFYISSFLYSNQTLIYTASAFLGLGAALIIVGQGQCLTENSNSRTIHRHAWIFWLFYQIFLLIRDLLVSHVLPPQIYDKDNATVSQALLKLIFIILITKAVLIVTLVLQEPPKEYSSGGLECIPNGKVVESEEPPEGLLLTAWKPLKNLLGLVVSSKMLLLSFMLGYAGLMKNLRYNRYSDDTTNEMTDIYARFGEMIGALFSAFCFCNKNGDSAMIVFMGLVMLAASFSFTSINVLQNKDNFWENPEDLPAGKLSYFRSMAMLERFSFGFGDACFHTQIYSLLGALFSKNCAPAFALGGLYYWVGYSFGYNYVTNWQLPSQLRFFLATGMLAAISVALVEILYVNRRSDFDIEKESLKTKETAIKSAKEVPTEIKMLYAGFNNTEKQEELPKLPISIDIPEVEILSEK